MERHHISPDSSVSPESDWDHLQPHHQHHRGIAALRHHPGGPLAAVAAAAAAAAAVAKSRLEITPVMVRYN